MIDINDWIKSYSEKYVSDNLISQKLIENYKYIDWLEAFTINQNSFSDDDLIYMKNSISDYDYSNIQLLNKFYNALRLYMQKNYSEEDKQNFYFIKHNNVYYEIGSMMGDIKFFYCKRLNTSICNNFINFDSIVGYQIITSKEDLQDKLIKLSNIIKSLYNDNVPLEVINDTAKYSIKKVKYKG